MDQNSRSPFKQGPNHVGPLPRLNTESLTNNNKQQLGSSSSGRGELQVTSEAQARHGGHDTQAVPVETVVRTQRDPDGLDSLEACLKHPDVSDDAQPASGAHSKGGVENTTRKATATSPALSRLLANPFSKPLHPQSKDNHSIDNNTTSMSDQSKASAPRRTLLPGVPILPVHSDKLNKLNNDLLPMPIPKPVPIPIKKPELPPSFSKYSTKPVDNSVKKTNLPSSVSSSVEIPSRPLSTVSRRTYEKKKQPRPSSLSSRAPGPSSSRVYFKGRQSYYTSFEPKSSGTGVSSNPSNRAMDGATSSEIMVRLPEKEHQDSSPQLSQPVPKVTIRTSIVPHQETQVAHSASHEYSDNLPQSRDRLENMRSSEDTEEALEDDQASIDSELSDVESIDPRSFSSHGTDSAPNHSPKLVIADSEDDDDDDDDNEDNNNEDDNNKDDDDQVSIAAETDDDSREDNNISATNKFCPYSRHSALDDTAYKLCKGEASVVVLKYVNKPG